MAWILSRCEKTRQSFYNISKIFSLQTLIRLRTMSVNETAIALRPFLFTVHPDLFGRFPREQAMNEKSLKLLNEYIEKLHNRQVAQPVDLTFYLRNLPSSHPASAAEVPARKEKFRTVRLLLVSNNVHDAIRSLLTACKLPLNNLENFKTSVGQNFNHVEASSTGRDSKENDMWKIFKGFEIDFNPRFHMESPSMESNARRISMDSLNGWLQKNVLKAHEKRLAMQPLRHEIQKLKEAILDETGLADIRWESEWTLSSYRTALKGLQRVYQKNSSSIDLEGKTVIFAKNLGICVKGFIILSHDVVSDSWTNTLVSSHQHEAVLNLIPSVQLYLSTLLKDVKIVPPKSIILAEHYLMQLRKLVSSIQDYRAREPVKSKIHPNLTDVELIVECTIGSLMISHSGQIIVPTSCPAFLIIDFLNANASKAKQTRLEFQRTELAENSIVESCQSILGLESLTRDPSITLHQMATCCSRLIRLVDARLLNVDLTSCLVRVAQFYSVQLDGSICIPWNFEDVI